MKKLLPFIAVFLFLSSCNQNQKPELFSQTLVNDTATEATPGIFTEKPAAEKIYVQVETREQNILREQDASIVKLLSSFKKQAQRFTLVPTSRGEVKGKQGTKISFPPGCFVTESGGEVSSPVDVELKECYTLDEMLQEGLTTSSDGKILESKGMIFVNATSQGETLKLKPGQTMQVEFPFALSDLEDYTFFYGEQEKGGRLNWNLAEDDAKSLAETSSNKSPNKQLQKAEFSYHGLGLKDYLISQLEYPEQAKRNELSEIVEVDLFIDTSGNAFLASAPSVYKTFREEIDSVVRQMPAWIPTTYGDEKFATALKVTIDFNIRRRQQITVDYNPNTKLVLTGNDSREFIYGNGNFFTQRIFSKAFDCMGWINCDRFLNFPQPKADVIVRADSKSDVRIVLKNLNSILGGETCLGYSRFRNLPVDAEVFVVSIRYEEGDIFYSVERLKLEKQTVVVPTWRKGSEEEIAELFKNLNSLS